MKIISDPYPDKEFEDILVEDCAKRTSNIKISVENNDSLLRSGMFARGVIFLKNLTMRL
ncbi:MAG: hypothetical protein LBS81_01785 [Endomicrobium sp.]|nr:hypothetical protein [Endomicrobium sp.]